MSQPRSVSRLIARAITPILALMFVLGLLGVIGVHRTNSAVNRVLDEVAPALNANGEYMQRMTDAETGIRGWVINDGEMSALAPYTSTLEALPALAAELHEYDGLRPDLAELLDEQGTLAEQWFSTYAKPRLRGESGKAGYKARRFAAGKATFLELRAVNARIDSSLTAAGEQSRHNARIAFRRVIIAMITLTLAAALVGWLVGRRLRREIESPLEDLEQTAIRLAGGDPSARAQVRGPREIAAVATAFNVLAGESERAHEVESETRVLLLDLDQAKSDFVSNVSHELRTPLTSIKGYLELLRGDAGELDPGTDRMWETVERNVDRLGALVEDLLTLAKVESHHTTLTEIDLRDVVDDVVTDMGIAAANRGIAMAAQLPARSVRVLADKTQLLRAVLNVVSNAVKFCRDGGNVDVVLVSDDEGATLTVRDTGIGIPVADLPQLGGRFFRGANAVRLEIGGTGLGVRMVQTILTKHGGRVAFDSVEGEYTLVTMELPVRREGYWEENGP